VLRRLSNGLIVTGGAERSFSVDRTELLAEAVELLEEVIILSPTGAVAGHTYALFWQHAQTFAPFSPPILPCSLCFLLRSFRYHRVKNAPVNYAIRFSGPVISLTARHVWYGV
jgi:hypothetical protein